MINDKTLGIAMATACALPLLVQVAYATLPAAVTSWGITEWLISYDGGFVRRGLPGSLVGIVSDLGITPSLSITVASVAFFAAAILFFVRYSRGSVPQFLVWSPFLFGAPIFHWYVVRKDLLVLLAFMLCLTQLKSQLPLIVRIISINLISILAVLSHEIFAFIALPVLAVLINVVIMGNAYTARGFLFLTPAGLATVIAVLNKGGGSTAVAITEAWNQAFRTNYPSYCCFDAPTAAIGAIGWTIEEFQLVVLSILDEFGFVIVYAPAAWIFSIVACAIVLASKIEWRHRTDAVVFLYVFTGQLLVMSPLFVVASDFGRWIFLIATTSTLVVCMFGTDMRLAESRHVNSVLRLCDNVRALVPNWLVLFVAIPGCCWGTITYLETNAIGANVIAVWRMATWF